MAAVLCVHMRVRMAAEEGGGGGPAGIVADGWLDLQSTGSERSTVWLPERGARDRLRPKRHRLPSFTRGLRNTTELVVQKDYSQRSLREI